MCPDARSDADKLLVEELKQGLAEALIRAGFPLFHGVDDPHDPALGYRADHGYIYQPVIDRNGKRRLNRQWWSWGDWDLRKLNAPFHLKYQEDIQLFKKKR